MQDILQLIKSGYTIVDVRSPGEFAQGHIPGAINIPLLDDEGRKIVGATYKKSGRDVAVQEGFRIAGPYFSQLIEQAKALPTPDKLIIYCWRGGLRSKTMGWLLGLSGINVIIIEGGYKAYRAAVRDFTAVPRKFIILGGKTGCGKTAVLQSLESKGEQVIDLEDLANHRGSAFGGLGKDKQPSNEQFENMLAAQLLNMDIQKPIWMENESKKIGIVVINDAFRSLMESAPLINIDIPHNLRVSRILDEYGKFGKEALEEAAKKIAKRLGPQHFKEAIQYLEEANLTHFIEKVLVYYDKTYSYSLEKYERSILGQLDFTSDQPDLIAESLIAFTKTKSGDSTLWKPKV